MTVAAKFYVQLVEEYPGSTASKVKLGAVCRGRENRQWASSTPNGNIEMSILNDVATQYFEQGTEYIVTFTKVDKPEFGDGHDPVPAPFHGQTKDAMCESCGVQAHRDEDGNLDWWLHDQLYVYKVNPDMPVIQTYMTQHNLKWASAS